METVKVRRSEYNQWLKLLYNQQSIQNRLFFIPSREQISIIKTAQMALPDPVIRTRQIYFQWTGRGYQCSHKLDIIDDIPCPALPSDMQYSIKHGYKTLAQTEEEVKALPGLYKELVKWAVTAQINQHHSN